MMPTLAAAGKGVLFDVAVMMLALLLACCWLLSVVCCCHTSRTTNLVERSHTGVLTGLGRTSVQGPCRTCEPWRLLERKPRGGT